MIQTEMIRATTAQVRVVLAVKGFNLTTQTKRS